MLAVANHRRGLSLKSINFYYENFESLKNFLSKNHDALYDWDPSAIFVQIFTGCDDRDFLAKVTGEVSMLLPTACVIGSTAGSVIMNGDICGGKTVISLTIFYHSNVRCVLLAKDGNSDFDLGAALAALLNSHTAKVLLVFTASQLINAHELLSGIGSINPFLPVAGGRSGDPCHGINAIISCNGEITEVGVVGVVLEGEKLTAGRHWHLGWQPIGKAMAVTKAEGLRVYTIDHLPAFEIYKKYLGLTRTGPFSNAAEYPLIIVRDGVQLARAPIVHYEDGSITFAGDIRTGEVVRLSFGNIGIILDGVESLCTTIKRQPVESLFVYSCACRRGYLQSLSSLETQPFQAIAPTAGFCASGEFFHYDNQNHLFNATITTLALSEQEGACATRNSGVIPLFKNTLQPEIETTKDPLAAKDVGVFRALTHLVNTVISELEQAQAKLQYNVIGEMAAGIGHEVRNPMTTVRGYLQMFQKKEEFSAYHRQLAVMIEELDRANLIITEFLSLSKHKRVEMKLGNINSVLNSLFPLLQADAFQHSHEILLALEDTPDFDFDEKEIRQLIVNLVRNGFEAMQPRGVLLISTKFSGHHVILSVKDTGSGIPPEILEKLGTPFVTTKDAGTGIGLSICFRIAERHRASIDITTGEQGTVFSVSFKMTHL
jgi:signal transduction histidine kinase